MTIVNKMRTHGEKLGDVAVIEKILRSLLPKYNFIVCSIEESKDLYAFSIDELENSLMIHEGRGQGHWRGNGRDRHRERVNFAAATDEEEEEQEEVTLLMVCDSYEETKKNLWYLDTGCINHMCGDRSTFSELDETFQTTVKFEDNSLVSIQGRGKVKIQTKFSSIQSISNVFYVPDLKINLLSVGQLQEKGYELIIKNGVCKIQDANLGLISKTSLVWLWHYRFGHLNFGGLQTLQQKEMVVGLPIFEIPSKVCEDCIMGKMPRDSFPKGKAWRASKQLELVHSDICGPLNSTSNGGKHYFITFTDDFSRKSWVYFLHEKYEAFVSFKSFKTLVEKEVGMSIKVLRSDRGGEYLSQELNVVRSLLRRSGVPKALKRWLKRKSECQLNVVRSLLRRSGVPKAFWAEVPHVNSGNNSSLAFTQSQDSQSQNGSVYYNRNDGNGANRGRGRGRGRGRSSCPQCQLCGRLRHLVEKCYHRFDMSFKNESSRTTSTQVTPAQANTTAFSAYPAVYYTPTVCYALQSTDVSLPVQVHLVTPGVVGDTAWYPDSGATHHITNDPQSLQLDVASFSSGNVQVGNGNVLPVQFSGQSVLDNRVSLDFFPNVCQVKDLRTKHVLYEGYEADGLYKFETLLSKGGSVNTATTVSNSSTVSSQHCGDVRSSVFPFLSSSTKESIHSAHASSSDSLSSAAVSPLPHPSTTSIPPSSVPTVSPNSPPSTTAMPPPSVTIVSPNSPPSATAMPPPSVTAVSPYSPPFSPTMPLPSVTTMSPDPSPSATAIPPPSVTTVTPDPPSFSTAMPLPSVTTVTLDPPQITTAMPPPSVTTISTPDPLPSPTSIPPPSITSTLPVPSQINTSSLPSSIPSSVTVSSKLLCKYGSTNL
ncbi:hypothetical protein GQ457_14G012020 [Hibiscus cannabinus]